MMTSALRPLSDLSRSTYKMALDPDILKRINADFDPQERRAVMDALCAMPRSGRVIRCILFASQGSLQRFRELLVAADLDDRNAILAGEYELGRQVRDLRVSFLVASPQDFWISDVAINAYKHGYYLANLETQTISTPPLAGLKTQGKATFVNGKRTITVQNRDDKWLIVGGTSNLASFGLDSPLEDTERFRVQLDFLLSRMNAEQTDVESPVRS